MSFEKFQIRTNQYFADKLETFGPTPKGVDYNGPEAQDIRFEQLVKVIDPNQKFSIVDYGCGYGALIDFLNKKGWEFDYYGIDLVEKMVIAGRESYGSHPNIHFTTDEEELPVAAYLIAGAIFNMKLEASYDEWQDFVLMTIQKMDALCSKGFSFNMLTKYADTDRMAERPDLFYGDPLFFFDYCKRHFSRNVALLHDYELYDFTILVRKHP